MTVQSVSDELLGITFDFPASELHLNSGSRQVATTSWKSLQVVLQNSEMRFVFSGLRIASNALPGMSLEADATLKIGLINLIKEVTLSLSIGFTAGLELGMVRNGLIETVGFQGSGTISVEVMGHSLHFQASFAANPDLVLAARNRTSKYLHIGLEATDVDDVPGIAPVPVAAVVAPPVTGLDSGQSKSIPPPSQPATFVPAPTCAADAPPLVARTGTFIQPDYVGRDARSRPDRQ